MASTTQPGPTLLEERSIVGILVHLLGAATFVVGPGVTYLVSNNEFTRKNARNAFDWQTLLATVLFGTLGLFGVAAAIDSALPDTVVTDALFLVAFAVTAAGVLLSFVVFLATFVFVVVATGKAIFGTTWRYPGSPDVVDRLAGRGRSTETRWWWFVGAYAIVAPFAAAATVWAIDGGYADEHGAVFAAVFVAILALWIGSPFVLAAIFRDAQRLDAAGASWRPNWIPYVTLAVVATAMAYAVATYAGSENPSGDATYGFFVAVWAVAVVYSLRRYRQVEASGAGHET